jgi:hypothetical protein
VTDYLELAKLADQILSVAEEDPEKLLGILDDLNPDIRKELINSDFLNAYQIFYYFFRTEPKEIIEDRLLLEPATSAFSEKGILIYEYDILEIFFKISGCTPEIYISDGDTIYKRLTGKDAYKEMLDYLDKGDFL